MVSYQLSAISQLNIRIPVTLVKLLKLYITGCRQRIFSRMVALGEVWLKIRQLQVVKNAMMWL
jgi:hypothetical protein